MFSVFKSPSIPNLRKKSPIIDLRYVDVQSCMVILFIAGVLLFSILCVVGAPNSNYPAGI
ncbi:hypothetical protein [Methanobacterium alcaliphilum]|uniref:hypothetical protein n=1 Tax=Methanobacterium alcaliphilum TaxID=392018 RepID=UPI002009E47C|nr:hypothetical protein [Methanobacterium alcaliphilum]MCK9152571.1 hypothetical protein [Methanobacterium alcaliphilum]